MCANNQHNNLETNSASSGSQQGSPSADSENSSKPRPIGTVSVELVQYVMSSSWFKKKQTRVLNDLDVAYVSTNDKKLCRKLLLIQNLKQQNCIIVDIL